MEVKMFVLTEGRMVLHFESLAALHAYVSSMVTAELFRLNEAT
jgi:hypothetical protein